MKFKSFYSLIRADQKLDVAPFLPRENPSCIFIATNTDAYDSIGGLDEKMERMMPGTGALVAAVEVASGVNPVGLLGSAYHPFPCHFHSLNIQPTHQQVVVGKEGPWMLTHLQKSYGVNPQRSCMIGDRLDTDIAMGHAGGMWTILTLSGVSTLKDAEAATARGQGPDGIMESIADLL